jgi:type IV pilus assembly protein PilB
VAERSRARKSPLGQLLVESGAITRDQLDTALGKQKSQSAPIGQVLVRMGYVTDDAVRMALASQLGIPFIDLDKTTIGKALGRVLNRNFARRHILLPVAQNGRTLTIAMDDPTRNTLVDDITRMTGLTVTVVTSSHSGIQRALKRVYDDDGPENGAEQAPRPSSRPVDAAKPLTAAGDEQVSRRADELFQQVLTLAIENRCSDIHLEMLPTGLHVRFRVDGVLRQPNFGALQQALNRSSREVISRVKILAKLDIAERRRPQDGSFRFEIERGGTRGTVDLRVSMIPSYSGESVVIRILDRSGAPSGLPDLRLGPTMTARIEQALRRTSGIFLVTGPTGSGKSTTLYACLSHLRRPEIRILTAEDPVEYVYEDLSQSEVNTEIGNTFAAFLRAFLRHDPEIIMLGEIRDEETAEMAFRAAQTGHLLLSTLHTNSAIAALPRLLDLGVDPSLVASSLLGVISQRLARQICLDCRRPDEPSDLLIREFFGDAKPDVPLVRGAGCAKCHHVGYRGRTLVADFWLPDEEDHVLIMRKAPFEEIRTSAERTTISMAQDAHARLVEGRTTLEELARVLPYASILEHRERARTKAWGLTSGHTFA